MPDQPKAPYQKVVRKGVPTELVRNTNSNEHALSCRLDTHSRAVRKNDARGQSAASRVF
jgi:hypothetical protein